jgi:hypothetical protein
MDDAQQAIFLAGDLYGGAGEDMLDTFDEIRKSMEKMKDIKGPLNDEDIANAQMLTESTTELGMRWDAIIQKLGAELAPIFNFFVEILDEVLWVTQQILKAWDKVQSAVEDAITYIFYAGEGADIELNVRTPRKTITGINRLKEAEKEKDIKFNLKSFSEGAQFQSSKAFDILNPNRQGSVQKEQLSELKAIKEAVQKQADGKEVKLVKQELK